MVKTLILLFSNKMSLLGTGVEKLAKTVLMQVTLIFISVNRVLIMMLTSRNLRILNRPKGHKKIQLTIHIKSKKVKQLPVGDFKST